MYYVATINGDNTQSFFAYDSMPKAMAAFHTEMAYANSQGITKTCVVMDSHGAVYRSEEYIASVQPVTEPVVEEPVEEPVEPTEE